MAKQKSNLTEFDIWVVFCLICKQDLATAEGQRPPYSVQSEHMATHGVDYRSCEPTKEGYVREDVALPGGGHRITSSSVYAENHGKGREVLQATRVFGAMDMSGITLEAAAAVVSMLGGDPSPFKTGAPEKPPAGATQSEKPQEARQEGNEYNPTGPPPNGLPEPSQGLLGAMVDPATPPAGPVPVHLVCGGPGGGYGGYSIYAPDYKLGTTYADPEDHYESLAHLLDFIERERGILCYAGLVEFTGKATTPEMISDDERITPLPKEKPKRKSAKPHYQNQEWYGNKGDRESWAGSVFGGG